MKINVSILSALSVAGLAWLASSAPAIAINMNTHGASCVTQGPVPV
jgi:hypothetical protein